MLYIYIIYILCVRYKTGGFLEKEREHREKEKENAGSMGNEICCLYSLYIYLYIQHFMLSTIYSLAPAEASSSARYRGSRREFKVHPFFLLRVLCGSSVNRDTEEISGLKMPPMMLSGANPRSVSGGFHVCRSSNRTRSSRRQLAALGRKAIRLHGLRNVLQHVTVARDALLRAGKRPIPAQALIVPAYHIPRENPCGNCSASSLYL